MAAAFLSPPSKPSPMADHRLLNGMPFKPSKQHQHQAPLVVPSGHVAFRMLCHVSLVGGFIGKSGSSIKQLQFETGSKIRVDDSVQPGSTDRVIVIVAANTPVKKLRLQNLDGGGEEFEVSAAQEAAIRVFEKVLEVSAEVNGGRVAGEVVLCRLLVDADQAGSVIGKGGKVVEKMRRESGARIRVLLGQHLPPGISPPDELLEIEGEVLAVKKALLGVSGRLQECSVVENSNVKESRPLESNSHPAVPDLRMDAPQFATVPRATDSSSSALVGRPLSLEVDNRSATDPNSQHHEVVFKILCSNDRVGGVIGRGGSIVRALQDETGASINVGPSISNCDERLITITSMEDVESSYSPAQRAVIVVFSRSIDAGIENGLETGSNKSSSITARLLAPSNQVGCLLGKGGAIVSEMRKATGTGIRILRDNVPQCASEDEEVVEVSGQFVNVQDALYQVTGRLRNNLFSSKVMNVPVPGSRMNTSATLDTGLHGRVREPPPNVLRQSAGRLGFIDGQATVSRLDHSSSPGFRISERSSGVNPRISANLSRVASAHSGPEIGRANRPPIVTNTTVEILVPETAIGSVYGENGSNLARIRQISGAKVTVHEPRPGSRDRTVIISGTPVETQAAQSLLHAFILTRPS